jgi:MFS transporter, DHA2 family, multidrug resistance protein
MPQVSKPVTMLSGAALGVAAVGLSLASFMQVLDQTIANVSIPTITGNLGASPNQGTWVVTSFGVASAISLPLTGWLAQRIGQVRLLLWSSILFVLASVLCGMASSLEMLVIARILQGAVAGPMMPLSQAMLVAIFPAQRRLMALSLWSTVIIVAPICGPLLGGWISDNWGWPWIFFINVPVGVLAVTMMLRSFRGRETPIRSVPIDLTGLLLLVVWVGSLQLLLDIGNDVGWFADQGVIWLAVIAVTGFCYFVVWELTQAHPVIELRLFLERNFSVGVLAVSCGYGIFFGTAILIPLWLQTQMGYSAAWAGLAAAPVSIFPLLLSSAVGRGLRRFDPRWFASLAFLAFACASFMRAGFTTQTDFASVVWAQLITGLGIAMFMVPLQSVILGGIRADQIASAAGLSSFIRVIGGSFGASIATSLWARRDAIHHAQLAEAVSLSNVGASSTLQALGDRGLDAAQSHLVMERLLGAQSSLMGVVDYFWLAGWMLLAMVIVVWLARPPFTPARAPASE